MYDAFYASSFPYRFLIYTTRILEICQNTEVTPMDVPEVASDESGRQSQNTITEDNGRTQIRFDHSDDDGDPIDGDSLERNHSVCRPNQDCNREEAM